MAAGPEPGEGRGSGSLRRAQAEAQHRRAQFEAQMRATRAQFDEMDARLEERAGRNLPRAIGIGLVLGGAVVVSLIIVKALWMVVAGVLVGFVLYELATAFRVAGLRVPRWATVVVGVLLIPPAFFFHSAGLWIAFLLGLVVLTLWRLADSLLPGAGAAAAPAEEPHRRPLLLDIGASWFVLGYAGLLGAITAALTAEPSGERWTLGFLIVVVVSDTMAYVSGLLLGRHKMAPRISPGKTWEGFAGSVLSSVLAGVLLAWLMLDIPLWQGAVFGLLIVLAATLGDLTESIIKRGLGIKDISTWLPGHGGFLDRIDSTLTAAPVAYLLYLIFT